MGVTAKSRLLVAVFSGTGIALLLALSASMLTAQRGLSFPTLPPDTPAGDGLTQPCLGQLQGEVLCGRFRVYENRQLGSGRTIDLGFVVVKALTDRGNTDAFTRFSGGPGASVTPNAAGIAEFRSGIRAERDILLLDHRGTGNSSPLPCDNPFPGGIESRFETVFPLNHVEACRDMLSQRVDLAQYTTPNAMDDLADVASWLGYSQLNLMGGSYGTREAQIFTRRHPEMVRTVIMNGVAPVDQRVYLYHARDLQDALDNLIAECASETACNSAYPDFEEVLREVLSIAAENPPEVTVQGTIVHFGIGPLSYALRGLLYGQAGRVPAVIYAAHAGDWQMLVDYYIGRQAWVGSADGTPAGYHYSVLCSEDIDPLSWEEIASETAGTFMGDFLIAGYKQACERWPSAVQPESYFTPVRSDKPALILSGGRDPVTPVSGGTAVAGRWSNSLHIVVPNGGHGQRGPCIDRMILKLVQSGSIDDIDVSCVSSAPPTRFVVGRD